jgi:hypothetical protein
MRELALFAGAGGNAVITVRMVSRAACAPLILDVHYARRWPSISYAFGLFAGEELRGVVTYGTPPSAPLRIGIAGPDYSANVLELNRLVLRYNEHNEASRLVGGSLRLLPPSIVVSFADTAQGHVGTVYQACNFGYYGLSAKRTDWKIKGQEHLHGQTIADRYRGVEGRAAAIRKDYGDAFYLSPRPRKHRYIYVVGDRRWRRKATESIRYRREAYPKDNHNNRLQQHGDCLEDGNDNEG